MPHRFVERVQQEGIHHRVEVAEPEGDAPDVVVDNVAEERVSDAEHEEGQPAGREASHDDGHHFGGVLLAFADDGRVEGVI